MIDWTNITKAKIREIQEYGKDAQEVLIFLLSKEITGEKWSVRSLAHEKGISKRKSEWWIAKIQKLLTGQSRDSNGTVSKMSPVTARVPEELTGQSRDSNGTNDKKSEKNAPNKGHCVQHVDNSEIFGATFLRGKDLIKSCRTEKGGRDANCIIEKPVKEINHFIKDIFNFYYKTFNIEPIPFSKESIKAIHDSLNKGYTVEQIKKAMTGYSLDNYFMKKKPLPSFVYLLKDDERLLQLISLSMSNNMPNSRKTNKTVPIHSFKPIPYKSPTPQESKEINATIAKTLEFIRSKK